MPSFATLTRFALILPLLAACASAPAPVVQAVPGLDPVTGAPVDLTPGFDDREPDVCHASEVAGLVGQPGVAMRTATTRPYRIVPLGSLVTQEYISGRIDVYLDANGNIARITCG